MTLKPPGTPSGPLNLPVSYHRLQLDYFGWDGKVFQHPNVGPWGSPMNDRRWQDQSPRLNRMALKEVIHGL